MAISTVAWPRLAGRRLRKKLTLHPFLLGRKGRPVFCRPALTYVTGNRIEVLDLVRMNWSRLAVDQVLQDLGRSAEDGGDLFVEEHQQRQDPDADQRDDRTVFRQGLTPLASEQPAEVTPHTGHAPRGL